MKISYKLVSFMIIVTMLLGCVSGVGYATESSTNCVRSIGDIDGNGKITARDLLMLKRFIVQCEIPSDQEKFFADMDYNNILNAKDFFELKCHLVSMVKDATVIASYQLDHYEDFLVFVENPSLSALVNSQKSRLIKKTDNSGRDGYKIYYEYQDINGEISSQTYDANLSKWYGISYLDSDMMKLLFDKDRIKDYLNENGVSSQGSIDNVFIIEPESWVAPAIVVVLGGQYYFIELNMDIDYIDNFKYEYGFSYKLYTYEEYCRKYSESDYVSININGKEVLSKYTAISNEYSNGSDANLIPVFEVLQALGAVIEISDNKTIAHVKFEDKEFIIAFSEDNGVVEDTKVVYECLDDGTYKNIVGYCWGPMWHTYFDGSEFICDVSYCNRVLNYLGYELTVDEYAIEVLNAAGRY